MTNSVPKNTAQNTRRSAGGTVDAQFSGSNPVKRAVNPVSNNEDGSRDFGGCSSNCGQDSEGDIHSEMSGRRRCIDGYHAGAELPNVAAGRSHCIDASPIATGDRSRRAGPKSVASIDSDQSSLVAGRRSPRAPPAGPLTSSCAVRAREVSAANPCAVATRCDRPRTTAAAMRYPVVWSNA